MISYNRELNDWMSIILQIWDNFYVISLQVYTKKKQNTRRMDILRFTDPNPQPPTSHPQKVTANLNLVKIFSQNRKQMKHCSDSNKIRTHNHLVRKRTLNHLVSLAKWLSVRYEPRRCGCDSHYYHLNFRYGTCFEQGVLWHSGKL